MGMIESRAKIKYLKRALFPAFCTIVIAYFAYHAINGNRGLIAWQKLKLEMVELQQELDTLRAERTRLEQRVSLMQPGNIDPDMLDQRAREILNLSRPDEITVLRNLN